MSVPVGRVALALLALPLCALVAPAQQRIPGLQLGARADAIASRAPTAQLGIGGNVAAGLYARIEGTLAAGLANSDGQSRGAARADLVARFVLDPFAESRLGVYALGGMSAMYDGFERWRPQVVLGLGIEARPRHGRAVALEVALGGGVRAGLVVRRARPARR